MSVSLPTSPSLPSRTKRKTKAPSPVYNADALGGGGGGEGTWDKKQASKFEVGAEVIVNWRGGEARYTGKITKVAEAVGPLRVDFLYDVVYADDKSTEQRVARKYIALFNHAAPQPFSTKSASAVWQPASPPLPPPRPQSKPLPSTVCQICLTGDNVDLTLLCDKCDHEYHMYCLSPPLASVPFGDWFCSSCLPKKAKRDNVVFFEAFDSEEGDDEGLMLMSTTSLTHTVTPELEFGKLQGPFVELSETKTAPVKGGRKDKTPKVWGWKPGPDSPEGTLSVIHPDQRIGMEFAKGTAWLCCKDVVTGLEANFRPRELTSVHQDTKMTTQRFLDLAKERFTNSPKLFNELLELLAKVGSQEIQKVGALTEAAFILDGHRDLLESFEVFFPADFASSSSKPLNNYDSDDSTSSLNPFSSLNGGDLYSVEEEIAELTRKRLLYLDKADVIQDQIDALESMPKTMYEL